MTPDAYLYRDLLNRLDLSQAEAARLFRVHPQTSKYWASGRNGVPHSVILCLQIMLQNKLDPRRYMFEKGKLP